MSCSFVRATNRTLPEKSDRSVILQRNKTRISFSLELMEVAQRDDPLLGSLQPVGAFFGEVDPARRQKCGIATTKKRFHIRGSSLRFNDR
jgi:hypothetical protein